MNLARMKQSELLDLAKANGLAAVKEMNREQLIELLKANAKDIREYSNPDELSGKKVKITINSGDPEKGENKDVCIGLNGKVWRIKRGHEVEIPVEVYQILCNAVESHLIQKGVNKENGNIEYDEVRRPRFNTTVAIPA